MPVPESGSGDASAKGLIPFNKPYLTGNEMRNLAEAFQNRRLSGDGPFTKRCHDLLKNIIGCGKVLLTTSCTHALEMTAILADIGPGDEVIVPSFTFVSTVNAFVLRGAIPVFCDIRPDTLNIDEKLIPSLITAKTKAIVPVHYAGVACEMDAIAKAASTRNIAIIEDNAHGLFGKYRGRALGSIGRLATLSFHETKNIQCGEGGALLINDMALAERAEIVREKGTNRSQMFRGQVNKYEWVDVGSSYLPAEPIAAILQSQLEQAAAIQQLRERVWKRYHVALADWARRQGVRLPIVPPEAEQAWHLFYLLFPSLNSRQRFIAHMKQARISAIFHYLPLHSSPMGLRHGGRTGQCPVTEDVSDRLVRLPFYPELCGTEQDRVIEAATGFAI